MSRPPVFTIPYCKPVSDHFPIGAGSASRRHKFPRLSNQAQPHPHLDAAKAVTGKPCHRDYLLNLLDALLGCPARVFRTVPKTLTCIKSWPVLSFGSAIRYEP